MKRIACLTLMVAQVTLFLLCVYWTVDAYVTPYQSE